MVWDLTTPSWSLCFLRGPLSACILYHSSGRTTLKKWKRLCPQALGERTASRGRVKAAAMAPGALLMDFTKEMGSLILQNGAPGELARACPSPPPPRATCPAAPGTARSIRLCSLADQVLLRASFPWLYVSARLSLMALALRT